MPDFLVADELNRNMEQDDDGFWYFPKMAQPVPGPGPMITVKLYCQLTKEEEDAIIAYRTPPFAPPHNNQYYAAKDYIVPVHDPMLVYVAPDVFTTEQYETMKTFNKIRGTAMTRWGDLFVATDKNIYYMKKGQTNTQKLQDQMPHQTIPNQSPTGGFKMTMDSTKYDAGTTNSKSTTQRRQIVSNK